MLRAFSTIRQHSLWLTLALTLVAGASQAQNRGTLAVAPTQADAALAPLAPGFDRWLEAQLRSAGLSAIGLEHDGDLASAMAIASENGFAHLLVPMLSARDGEASVKLLLYAPDSQTLLVGASSNAATADLGQAAAEVLERVVPQLAGGEVIRVTPPLFDDLVSTSLSMRALDRGDLPAAFRAVQGKLSPTAMALREEITDEARQSGTPPATRARVLAAVGDPTTAWGLIARKARAELAKTAPDPALLIAAGEVLLAQDAVPEARRYFSRALEVEPDHLDANAGIARVLELEGNGEGARDAFARAAQLAPHDSYLAEELARVEQDPALSAAHWIEAGRRSAHWLDARRARIQLETAASVDPAAAPRASSELGALEARLGRPEQARTAYRRAVAGGVRTPVVLTALGTIDYRLGDTASAETNLRKALELQPKHTAALRELGVLYTENGRAADALPMLREVRALDPGDSRARVTLSRALRATGEMEEAMALMSGEPGRAPAQELAEIASLQADRGDLEAARESLARAVQIEPGDTGLRGQLAEVLEQVGDAAAAIAERQIAGAFGSGPEENVHTPQHAIARVLSLDDLIMSFAAQVPQQGSRRIAMLGVREPQDWEYRLRSIVRPHSPDIDLLARGLEAAIAARFKSAPVGLDTIETLSLHVDRLFDYEADHSLNAETIATVNQVLAVDGSIVTRLIAHEPGEETLCEAGSFAVDIRLLMGRDADTASILSNFDCLEGGYEAYGRWNILALVLYAALLLLVSWPLIRGWGQVVVHIRLPDRTKGFFSIHITKRPDQVKREVNEKTKMETSKGSRLDFLRRFQRHMAGADTTFRLIPARKLPYTVTVTGPLMDARGKEIIGHFLEEQRVNVKRRRASELTFDFRPKEVAVEVTITEGGRPAKTARVGVQGDPSSLRYAHDGVAYLYLGLGSYTILVGSHDSAAQFEIDISSLETAIPLKVDMGRTEGLLFQGCPDAVEAYLQSDFSTAAQALDNAGNTQVAHMLRAELHRLQGRGEDAARELEAAGQIGDAAAIRTSSDDFEGGAVLYEEAGEIDQAARAYRDAGSFAEAARCYEKVYDYGNALDCWREVGDSEREMIMLEKLGEFMEAALIARQRDDKERAIQNLQQIEPRHNEYGDACRVIAEIASQDGDHEVAVAKFEEALSSTGLENASVETLESYADVLERAGRRREALSAYEAIRRQDVARTDIATRIQALRAELAESDGATQQMATPAAPQESRYELLEEIGRGGMGVVFKARDKRLGRVVALKRLPENLRDHPTAVELFEREARAAAALNHVNIVTLFDAGEEDGSFFITMELLEGRPLNVILDRSGRVSVADTLRLGVQICAGLNCAHERRIVHRDIKTANLFFTKEQVVKIMDFGIAKSLEEVRRSTTVVGGTPYYMAPEQGSGVAVDHRADLYAFGVTLFQLSTGQLPFSDGDVAYRHRHEEPPDPREINLNVTAGLAQVILELMQKSPDARPPNAATVGARLAELLAELK